MSETQEDYIAETEEALELLKGEPVVQFEKPSEQIVETEEGYEVVKSLGWIKFSAAFRKNMLKQLKGAKLGIFMCICLHLNENGESFPGIDKIASETGYHRDTVMVEIAEMEKISGLMRVIRERGKPNHYIPAFVARGVGKEPVGKIRPVGQPVGEPVDKTQTGLETTSLENPDSKESLREKEKEKRAARKQELAGGSVQAAIYAGAQVTQEMLDAAKARDLAPKAFEAALGFSNALPWWSNVDWTRFADWVVERYIADPRIFEKYETWRNTPFVKGAISNNRIRGFVKEFYDSFDMFMKSAKPEAYTAPEQKKTPYEQSLENPQPLSAIEQQALEDARARWRTAPKKQPVA